MPSSLFLPSSSCLLICDVPHFQAHQPAPPSSSPPVGESSAMCHISKLTNLLLPLPPLQSVSLLQHATFPSSPTHSQVALTLRCAAFKPRYRVQHILKLFRSF